ncbi:hypothetical protein AAF712_005676 [Marasmius tenuissimus]|uniref:Uncharacterized protein n=1 Tax=Marasmius tenuissimus TaxID=585030 RepID=A0ABR3A2L5_9AGAR
MSTPALKEIKEEERLNLLQHQEAKLSKKIAALSKDAKFPGETLRSLQEELQSVQSDISSLDPAFRDAQATYRQACEKFNRAKWTQEKSKKVEDAATSRSTTSTVGGNSPHKLLQSTDLTDKDFGEVPDGDLKAGPSKRRPAPHRQGRKKARVEVDMQEAVNKPKASPQKRKEVPPVGTGTKRPTRPSARLLPTGGKMADKVLTVQQTSAKVTPTDEGHAPTSTTAALSDVGSGDELVVLPKGTSLQEFLDSRGPSGEKPEVGSTEKGTVPEPVSDEPTMEEGESAAVEKKTTEQSWNVDEGESGPRANNVVSEKKGGLDKGTAGCMADIVEPVNGTAEWSNLRESASEEASMQSGGSTEYPMTRERHTDGDMDQGEQSDNKLPTVPMDDNEVSSQQSVMSGKTKSPTDNQPVASGSPSLPARGPKHTRDEPDVALSKLDESDDSDDDKKESGGGTGKGKARGTKAPKNGGDHGYFRDEIMENGRGYRDNRTILEAAGSIKLSFPPPVKLHLWYIFDGMNPDDGSPRLTGVPFPPSEPKKNNDNKAFQKERDSSALLDRYDIPILKGVEICHCGCTLEDALWGLYIWKTGKITSGDDWDNYRKDWIDPRQRKFIIKRMKKGGVKLENLWEYRLEERGPLHVYVEVPEVERLRGQIGVLNGMLAELEAKPSKPSAVAQAPRSEPVH